MDVDELVFYLEYTDKLVESELYTELVFTHEEVALLLKGLELLRQIQEER